MASATEAAEQTGKCQQLGEDTLNWHYLQPKYLAIKAIHGYRLVLSPWIGNQCRFYPTCSHYAEQAINLYGFTKGTYLSARRLIKCHPWHPGGLDPVPPKAVSTLDSAPNKKTQVSSD